MKFFAQLCQYFKLPKKSDLVTISSINPRIIHDIRYATENNFTGKKVYSGSYCFAQRQVAQALDNVQKELETRNFGLKIFDGYRPRTVSYLFWELVPDERYVANPAKGSRHNRGCAVDVTLVDKMGKELLMPSEFDDFSERAHRNYMNLPEEVIKNRELLETVMLKHGFTGLSTEWWHFDFKGWEAYPLLDISFEELQEK